MHSTPAVSGNADSTYLVDPHSSSSSSSSARTHPAMPSLHSASRQQALLDAVLDNDLRAVGMLLSTGGIDINEIAAETGLTPLMLAAAGGMNDMAELLLEKRASVQITDRDGLRAFHHAARWGHGAMAQRLQSAETMPGVGTSPGVHNRTTTTTTITTGTTNMATNQPGYLAPSAGEPDDVEDYGSPDSDSDSDSEEDKSGDKAPARIAFNGVLQIPAEEIVIGDYLAEGVFGQVYRGQWGKLDVALKKIDIERARGKMEISEEEAIEALQWEVARLAATSHPNVVRFYGICHKEGAPHLVMEFCAGGSLRKALEREKQPVPDSRLWQWMLEIAQGLAYMHAEGMLHRDLKADNVLIDSQGCAKLADLSVAQVDVLLQSTEARVVSEGMQDGRYAAPENIGEGRNRHSSKETDIYALGLVFWEMVSGGRQPTTWEEEYEHDSTLADIKAGKRMPMPDACHQLFQQLIRACWKCAPSQRATIADVVDQLKVMAPTMHPEHALVLLTMELEKKLHVRREEARYYVPCQVTERAVEGSTEDYLERMESGGASTSDRNNALRQLEMVLMNFVADTEPGALLLSGQAGLGKTLSTHVLANRIQQQWRRHFADPEKNEKPRCIPILIRDHVASWTYPALNNACERLARKYGAIPGSVTPLIIVDGYDECRIDEAPGNLARHLGMPAHGKLVITCRPGIVPDDQLQQRFALNDKLTTCHYLPFSEQQLLTYLKDRLRWDDATHGLYKAKLRAAPSLRALLRNPLVLHLFWQSWDTLSKRPLDQLTRSEIYAGFIGHVVNSSENLLEDKVRKQLSAGHASLAASFTAFARKVAMLACEGHDIALSADNPRINSAWNGFQVLAEQKARRRYQQRENELAQQAPEAMREQARRMVLTEDDFVRMRRQKAMQLAAALPLRPRAGTLEFVHKSIFEYCVAQALADMLMHKPERNNPERISDETVKDMVSWLRTTSPDALLLLREELDKASPNDGTVRPPPLSKREIIKAILIAAVANVLQDRNEPEAALRLHEQALEIRRKVLVDDHLDTADSLHRIGDLLRALGRVSEARTHIEEALQTRLKMIPQHADTARTYYIGGLLQLRCGEFRKALESFRAALEIQRKELGEHDPDTAQSYLMIDEVRGAMKRHGEGQDLPASDGPVEEGRTWGVSEGMMAYDLEVQRLAEQVAGGKLVLRQKQSPVTIMALAALLARPQYKIRELDLRHAEIGDAALAWLSTALKVNRTVTYLDLWNNQIGVAGAASLSEALNGNGTLTGLDLGMNKIGTAGVASLSEALNVNRTLTELKLEWNDIGTGGAASLSEALKGNRTLTWLDLGCTQIGAGGAASLAKALEVNSTLRVLHLEWGPIGDTGAASLSKALEVNRTLRVLHLDRNNIGAPGATSLSKALMFNRALTGLHLGNNYIGNAGTASLSEGLKTNRALTNLGLDSNQIGDAGAVTLSKALKVNKTLTVLDLMENRIGPAGAGSLFETLMVNRTLTGLGHRDNPMGFDAKAAIDRCLERNRALTASTVEGKLELTGTQRAGTIEALAVLLASPQCKVSELHISNCTIDGAGAALLSKALKADHSLTTLYLLGNQLGDAGTFMLSEALKDNRKLTELHLYDNNIGNAGVASLSEALKGNYWLAGLHLDGNQIGDSGAGSLSKALQDNRALAQLDLTRNDISDAGAASLSEVLKADYRLTGLNLANNYINAAGAASLSEALKVNKTLTKLDLYGNNIGVAGAASLSRALRVNRKLTMLDLYGNCIGDAGAVSLSKALKVNRVLTKIDLGSNHIGAAGVAALSQALKDNWTLTHLDLRRNEIDDDGAASLSEALRGNRPLAWLGLGDNYIDAAGAASLSKALEGNWRLTRLDLDCNNIGDDGAASLSTALKLNSTLAVLHLGNNNIGAGGATSLSKALMVNRTLDWLGLRDNNIGAPDEALLSEALEEWELDRELAMLDHANNNIDIDEIVPFFEPGAASLSAALEDNSTLTRLELDNNRIDPEVKAAIESSLERNRQSKAKIETGKVVRNQIVPASNGSAKESIALATLEDVTADEQDVHLLAERVAEGKLELRGKQSEGTIRALAALLASPQCQVKSLDLNGAEIGDDGVASLSKALKVNRTLTVLHLGNNYIGAAGAASLAETLKYNSTLTVLHLGDNYIGAAGAAARWLAALADSLKSSDHYNIEVAAKGWLWEEDWEVIYTLSRLDRDKNKVGASGAALLSDALKANRTLTVLGLANNNIDEPGAASLSEALMDNRTLTRLELDNNGIDPEVQAAIKSSLERNRQLKAMIETGTVETSDVSTMPNQIVPAPNGLAKESTASGTSEDATADEEEVQRLAEQVAEGKLEVKGKQSEGTIKALAALLASPQCKVVELDLRDAQIGDAGAALLSEALNGNCTLVRFNLLRNQIGDAGAASLAAALKVNRTLTDLALSGNNIGAAGAASLSEALKVNRMLAKLNLMSNRIGDDGAALLSEALKVNDTLATLYLYGNGIGDDGAASLLEALKGNRTLALLPIGGNKIGDQALAAIKSALERND